MKKLVSIILLLICIGCNPSKEAVDMLITDIAVLKYEIYRKDSLINAQQQVVIMQRDIIHLQADRLDEITTK